MSVDAWDQRPLFSASVPKDMELYYCDLCPAAAVATPDMLRVIGWTVFDGKSETGKDLHVRLCRACRKGES